MPIDLDPYAVRSMQALRAYWRHVRGPCGRCGQPIDWDGPAYRMYIVNGRTVRRYNPWALDVGHIVERDRDRRCMYAPIDTRPEHALCNRKAGAVYGNRKRGALRALRARASRSMPPLRTSKAW